MQDWILDDLRSWQFVVFFRVEEGQCKGNHPMMPTFSIFLLCSLLWQTCIRDWVGGRHWGCPTGVCLYDECFDLGGCLLGCWCFLVCGLGIVRRRITGGNEALGMVKSRVWICCEGVWIGVGVTCTGMSVDSIYTDRETSGLLRKSSRLETICQSLFEVLVDLRRGVSSCQAIYCLRGEHMDSTCCSWVVIKNRGRRER